MCTKEPYVVSAAIMMVVIVMIFFPGMGSTGNLEPSSAPAPTMKTLDQIPPIWSIKIPGTDRFVVLADFNNEAVLDKETGLVWEKAPSTTFVPWLMATKRCANAEVSGRKGWHLPTIEQLASLVDTTATGALTLPAGHPFTNVQSYDYWSASNVASVTTSAWIVNFGQGFVAGVLKDRVDPAPPYVWCVRGGQSSYDTY